jgi:hypothetical protein
MAQIEDLGKKSLADLSQDEALEMLRVIRLSRRTQKAPKKSPKATKAKKTQSSGKLSAAQAKLLLKMLEG